MIEEDWMDRKRQDFLLRSRKTRNKVDCLHANEMDAASIENVGTYVEENRISFFGLISVRAYYKRTEYPTLAGLVNNIQSVKEYWRHCTCVFGYTFSESLKGRTVFMSIFF